MKAVFHYSIGDHFDNANLSYSISLCRFSISNLLAVGEQIKYGCQNSANCRMLRMLWAEKPRSPGSSLRNCSLMVSIFVEKMVSLSRQPLNDGCRINAISAGIAWQRCRILVRRFLSCRSFLAFPYTEGGFPWGMYTAASRLAAPSRR